MRNIVAAVTLSILGACATGNFNVSSPTRPASLENSILVPKKRAEVWAAAIPRLGQNFFVINNLDQSSGFINVSYSGDPEAFVDGGTVTATVENARGPRTYTFPASTAHATYEIVNNGNLITVERRMSLEGRANIILEDVPGDQTRVTANVRYILTRNAFFSDAAGHSAQRQPETATFNSGQMGVFTGGSATSTNASANTYWPTGKLERDILAAFR
jgi:hypothetical protein